MTAHSVSILSELQLSFYGPYALSINCAINCTLLKAVPHVQQFFNFVNSVSGALVRGGAFVRTSMSARCTAAPYRVSGFVRL